MKRLLANAALALSILFASVGLNCQVYAAHKESCARYLTIRMDDSFIGDDEEDRTHLMRDEQERDKHRVRVNKDGKLIWYDGRIVDTAGIRITFVMSASGEIYLYNQNEPMNGGLHHSTFLAGAPVAGAGNMIVEDGVVTTMDNGSGHYAPPLAMLAQVRDSLKKKGAPVEQIAYRRHNNDLGTPVMTPEAEAIIAEANIKAAFGYATIKTFTLDEKLELVKQAFSLLKSDGLFLGRAAETIWKEIPFDIIRKRLLEPGTPEMHRTLLMGMAWVRPPDVKPEFTAHWARKMLLSGDPQSEMVGTHLLGMAGVAELFTNDEILKLLRQSKISWRSRVDLLSTFCPTMENRPCRKELGIEELGWSLANEIPKLSYEGTLEWYNGEGLFYLFNTMRYVLPKEDRKAYQDQVRKYLALCEPFQKKAKDSGADIYSIERSTGNIELELRD